MAYLQHDVFALGGAGAGVSTVRALRTSPTLTPLERQVVAIAEREPLSSLSTARRPIASVLFGVEPARALADPRTEALRRFVVLHRHGSPSAQSSAQRLAEAGFAQELIDQLRGRFTDGRMSRLPGAVAFSVVVVLFATIVALIERQIGELLPSIAVGLAVSLPFVSILHALIVPAARRTSARLAG